MASPYRALAEAGELLAAGRPARARDLAARFLDHEDAAHRRRAERLVAEADEVIAAATGPVVELGDEEVHWGDEEEDFAAFVESLEDEAAAGYRDQPAQFRRACLAVFEGRLDKALPWFEALVEEEPDDPIRRLERGHARLCAGDLDGAVADLETVWPLLGDDHLDRGRMLSVPLLWAETMFEAGKGEAVVDRLAELVETVNDPTLANYYGAAMAQAGQLEEALAFLARWRDRHFDQENLHLWTAHLLAESGRLEAAIRAMEEAVGRFATPDNPLPDSLRKLFELRLLRARRDGEPPDPRCAVLCELLIYAVDGEPTGEDLDLLATFHALSGDEEGAADLRRQAEGTVEGRVAG